ncbi:MAG: NADH-quinone oxidoreductase subunit H [SAR324 cluster bacterium]|nr:NADH-quinone oxidoreductase subunit H [SAR324 cluster bacterium]
MDVLIGILLIPTVQAVLKIFVIIFALVMPLATVLTLMERKWSAMIQDRVGPNRANIPFLNNFRGRGALHIAADGLKSFFKEDFIPEGADRFLFTIAPYFGFAAAMATFAIIPFAGPIGDFTFQITDVKPGLLYIFAITSLGVYGTVLAGAGSNSKFALLGGTRASAQMLSYEVFIGLSLLGVFMVYESTQISVIVNGQNTYWFGNLIPKWGVLTQPIAFFLFFTAMIAETKRAPFDAPEGESEIVAGYFLEYSGMRFAAFMLAEYIALVGVSVLVVTLFFGGYHIPWLHLWESAPQWLVSLLQFMKFTIFTFFFCWLQLQIRWTVPKFRFDQTMALGWKKLLPVALGNVVVTAFIILIAN